MADQIPMTPCPGWATASDVMTPTSVEPLPAITPALEFPLLGVSFEVPVIRPRLQSLCGLYSHARDHAQRQAVLDRLEEVVLQLAHVCAVELLEAGWVNDAAFDEQREIKTREMRGAG